MRNYLFFVLSLAFLACKFLLSPDTVKADTFTFYPNSNSSCSTWTTPSNLYVLDSAYGYIHYNDETCILGLPADQTMPIGSKINSVNVTFYGNSSGNAGSQHVTLRQGSTTCDVGGNTANFPTLTMQNGTHDLLINSSNCANIANAITVAAVQGGTERFYFTNMSGGSSIDQDAIKLVVNFDKPSATVNLDAYNATSSAMQPYMWLSGDTATKSAIMQCDITVGEYCNDPASSSGLLKIAVPNAYLIKLNAAYPLSYPYMTNLTTTYGAGFSATSSAWTAFVMPKWRDKYACYYPMNSKCWHSVNGTIYYDTVKYGDQYWYDSEVSSGTNTYMNEWGATFSGVLDTNYKVLLPTFTNTKPSCATDINWYWCTLTNLISDLKDNLAQAFHLGNNPTLSDFTIGKIDSLKSSIAAKQPFAYFLEVFNMPRSDVGSPSSLLNFQFSFFGLPSGNATMSSVNVTMPSYIQDLFGTIKSTMTVLLYALLIPYLMWVVQRATHDFAV